MFIFGTLIKKIKETFNGKIKNFIARRKSEKYIYKGFKCAKR